MTLGFKGLSITKCYINWNCAKNI